MSNQTLINRINLELKEDYPLGVNNYDYVPEMFVQFRSFNIPLPVSLVLEHEYWVDVVEKPQGIWETVKDVFFPHKIYSAYFKHNVPYLVIIHNPLMSEKIKKVTDQFQGIEIREK